MQRGLQKWATSNGNAVTQAPTNKFNTGDVLTDEWHDVATQFGKGWESFSSRFSNAKDWQKLMLDERV